MVVRSLDGSIKFISLIMLLIYSTNNVTPQHFIEYSARKCTISSSSGAKSTFSVFASLATSI